MEAILSEFLRSLGVGAGIPIAFYSVFRLRKGGFTKSSFTKSSFTVQRVEINKQSLVMLIVAILALYPIFL
ncbi:MAG: hypothetical protein IIC15_01720 [Thaumarchaeota archaeon]|nr:hypothetical protein [Nitrososphaerota archaeon]